MLWLWVYLAGVAVFAGTMLLLLWDMLRADAAGAAVSPAVIVILVAAVWPVVMLAAICAMLAWCVGFDVTNHLP